MTEKQLKELLADLTFEEKLGELQQITNTYFGENGIVTGSDARHILNEDEVNLAGSVINVVGPAKIREIQEKHIKNHPHHIPMMFMFDIIHGFATIFPIPLAQSCSFEPDLVEAIARETAREACVSGLHVTFSPMVDICRDARWGRVMESYGEDPYLTSKMGVAAVKGYQGDDLSKEGTLAACVKHFAAYGLVEGGREYGVVDTSERFLRQYYLPAYKAGCDAGSALIMSAFTANAGVPADADKHLMSDILRDEWGYEGAHITDYGSTRTMKSHGVPETDAQVAKLALEAQVDIEMCLYCYHNGLPELLEKGEITMEQIDRAVMRVLQLKNKLGLFENPYRYTDAQKSDELKNNSEALALAQDAVSRSSVLLKNEDKLLPLNADDNKKVAFIGPYVEEPDMFGGWSIRHQYKIDLKNIHTAINERYPNGNFTFNEGCMLLGKDEPMFKFNPRRAKSVANYVEHDAAARKEKIAKAVEDARNADVVVMCIGEHTLMGGELTSRTHIEIPLIQKELFDAVEEVNDNIIVVLFNHRPLDISDISEKAKAVIVAWFPGIMAADGITDMLFGEKAPTGRLTMCFPHTVGQCPIYYANFPTSHSPVTEDFFVTGYIDCPLTPLYTFGEGMTYTEFEYGEIKLSKETLSEGETLTASVDITNVGDRDGVETVQLYIRDPYAAVSRPLKELKGFKKVAVKKGETVNVEFTLTTEDLKFYNVELDYICELGEIQVFIGKDSAVKEHADFQVI